MQRKKLLTIDDLVKFCVDQKFYNFNADQSGYQLAVQVPSMFSIDNQSNDDTLLFCNVKLFHIGVNRNHSSVTEEAAQKSLSTIAYKPLLANFCEINGVKDFTSHDMEIDDDNNIHYIERQIGCFTSDQPEIKYDEENDKKFVYARVAIPREYTDACDIIERKNGTKVSVELIINDMSYSVEDKVLQLNDIVVSGATCLGKDPISGDDVEEGMKGARLDIESFSNNNNAVVNTYSIDNEYQSKLVETLEKLNNTLSNFHNDTIQRGGENMDVVEELKENESVEQSEISENNTENIEQNADASDNENVESNKLSESSSEENENGDILVSEECDADGEVEEQEFEIENKVDFSNNLTIKFDISHEDIRYCLYNLLSSVEEIDNDYYYIISVYDDYFIYQGYCSNKFYKHSYSVADNEITLGDRVEVYNIFVTKEEKDALDTMKEEYTTLKAFKEGYDANELRVQKYSIISDEDYDTIRNTDEFKSIENNFNDYELSELKEKLDLLYASFAKQQARFAKKEAAKQPKTSMKFSVESNDKAVEKPYGDLFK